MLRFVHKCHAQMNAGQLLSVITALALTSEEAELVERYHAQNHDDDRSDYSATDEEERQLFGAL